MSVDTKSLRTAKLKFAEDGRPATLAAVGDDRAEFSRNERIKLEKAAPLVWNAIVENYALNGFDAITDDDLERFKWVGVYQQKPKGEGHFMMRLKIVGGIVSTTQLRGVSHIARTYCDSIADITTRQTYQVHWLTIDQMPAVMDELEKIGLGVKAGLFGACGDICRNIVTSPLNNLETAQVIDPTDFFTEANYYFSSTPEYADLPRKFKVAIVGHRAGGQCEINDLSFYGVKKSNGETGYGVMVGGGLSTEPHLAQDLGVFVKPDQAMKVFEAVVQTYRDFGYRKSRKHARIKYLVADWGADKFRDEIEKVLGYQLEKAESALAPLKGYEDHYGARPQIQEGLNCIGVPVIGGRVTSDQWDGVADIADEFGSGEVRFRVMQSFYIPNVKTADVPTVEAKLVGLGFNMSPSPLYSGMVACTGIQYCNLAVAETKNRAKDVALWLDENVKFSEAEHFRVNINGCPNSCGQHWIADIGFQGCQKKVDGVLKEHWDVFLGGSLGSDARFNRRIKRIVGEEVEPTIKKIIEAFQTTRQGDESFAKFVERQSDEELELLF